MPSILNPLLLFAGLGFTWLFTPTLFYIATCLWLQPQDDSVLPRWWSLLLPSGPIAIALLLWGLYTAFPGQPHSTYIYSVLGFFTLLTLTLFFITKSRKTCYVNRLRKHLITSLGGFNMASFQGVGALAIVLTVLVVVTHGALALLHPVLGSDSAQYAFVSRMGYDLARFDFYPFYQPDALYRYVDTSDHPPTYYFLKIWHFLLAGSAQTDGWSKLIEPMMLASCSLMLSTCLVSLGFGLLGACTGVLLWVSMPALTEIARFHGIDLYYMAPFMAASLWLLTEIRVGSSLKYIVMGGILSGLAMATHNLMGLIMLPMVGLIYTAIVWPMASPGLWFRAAAVTLAGALPLGSIGFVANLFHHGQLVGAGLPLLDTVSTLQYYQGRKLSLGINSPLTLLTLGGFKLWAMPHFFGPLPWAALVSATPTLPRTQPKTPPLQELPSAALSVRGAFAGVATIVALNLFSCLFTQGRISILAMNPRYSLLAGVFLAVLTSAGLNALAHRFEKQAKVILILAFTAAFVYATTTLIPQAQFALNGQGFVEGNAVERWAGSQTNPTFTMLKRLQSAVPKNGVLITPHKDLVIHYLRRAALSESDPALLPFYTAKSSTEALAVLDQLGVTHIAQYPDAWPTHQGNSQWGALLADPAVFQLVDEHYLLRVFKRIPGGQPTRPKPLAKATALTNAPQAHGTNCLLWHVKEDIAKQALNHLAPNDTSPYIVAGQALGSVDVFLADMADPNTQHHQWLWHHVVPAHQPQVFAAQFSIPKHFSAPVLGLCPARNTPNFKLQFLQLMHSPH